MIGFDEPANSYVFILHNCVYNPEQYAAVVMADLVRHVAELTAGAMIIHVYPVMTPRRYTHPQRPMRSRYLRSCSVAYSWAALNAFAACAR